jgi:peptidoglycan/xylan/chitin deacetylase (PgdA/CDA1 family)
MKVCLKLHGVGVPPPDADAAERDEWIDEDRFGRIVELARKAPASVHLTFDDGNASDVEIVLPALSKAGLTASFFFSTDFIGRPGFADEEDIRRLHAAGMEIGSHGCRHASWRDMSGDQITEDVIRSFARLETILGESVTVVAAPYDECDLRVLRILHKLGIRRAYTGFGGPALAGDWMVRRFCIGADTPWAAIETWLTKSHGRFDWALAAFDSVYRVRQAAFWRARQGHD